MAEAERLEEAAVLLAGIVPDMAEFVDQLLVVNPPLAARRIAESGGEPSAETIQTVQKALVEIATSRTAQVAERNAAGNALNYMNDPRPGVGMRGDGVPDIVWCKVPAGEFVVGKIFQIGTIETGERAFDGEMPQHKVNLTEFSITEYPITNAQYQAFVDDGGYTEKWQECWTQAGWKWREKEGVLGLRRYGGDFDLANHPAAGVSFYEAVAFCNSASQEARAACDAAE